MYVCVLCPPPHLTSPLQEEAVSAISRAIRRARVGLKNPNRPIASFIFAGPTGVGKSELAKTLASYYFGSEDAMVRGRGFLMCGGDEGAHNMWAVCCCGSCESKVIGPGAAMAACICNKVCLHRLQQHQAIHAVHTPTHNVTHCHSHHANMCVCPPAGASEAAAPSA